jgi:hypothetical protein
MIDEIDDKTKSENPKSPNKPDRTMPISLGLWIKPWRIFHWFDICIFHVYNIAYIGMYVKD